MHFIRIQIAGAPSAYDPAGLLVPIPPDTVHQQLVSFAHSDRLAPVRAQAYDREQTALFVPGTAGAHASFEFTFAPSDGARRPAHFAPAINRYVAASPELAAAIAELIEGASGEGEKLRRIIDFTASLFDYDHPPVKFYEGKDAIPLLREMTKGSCLDINTFLMSSLYVAGIPAAYYSGYFFAAEKPPTSNHFHCWVSTFTEGEQQDWDIAHHISAGTRSIKPGLNPKPGVRLAMSCGRGLKFPLGAQDVWVSHLGSPVWVRRDGRHYEAEALATLTNAGGSHDLGPRIPRQSREIRV
jgi:transglutaminase-like putative cysteine protease